MDRNEKVHIALGMIGSIVCVTAALVTAQRRETVVWVILLIFANFYTGRTISLIRQARNRSVERRASAEAMQRRPPS